LLAHFRKRGRALDGSALETLLNSADLIPYDVQRIAHELWDYAKVRNKRQLDASDVNSVIDALVAGQSNYYELLWEQLSARQRAAFLALAYRGASAIYSQNVREEFRLGPATKVQKALQSLDSRDVLDRYKGSYFFLDPLLSLFGLNVGRHRCQRAIERHFSKQDELSEEFACQTDGRPVLFCADI